MTHGLLAVMMAALAGICDIPNQVVDAGIYRVYRYGYDEVPEPDPVFKNTDGHLHVPALSRALPDCLGLPSTDLP